MSEQAPVGSDEYLAQPDQWATGGEAMTGKQAGFAKALASEAGVDFDPSMSKSEASQLIDELKSKTSVGQSAGSGSDEATDKQKGFIAALEKKAGESVTGGKDMTKNEASERIEELKPMAG